MASPQGDDTMIEQFLVEVRGMTQKAAAERLGVDQRTISRWRAGDRRSLRGDTRSKLERFLTSGMGRAAGLVAEEDDLSRAWLRDFESTVRLAGGKDMDPAERQRLRKDLINSMIDARKQRGADVPQALYELLGRVDRGEL